MFTIERLKVMIFTIPAIIIGITVHEFSHAFMASKFGDDSARLEGRLTLNPLTHLDPFGFLMLILLGFGWAKPVVYDPRNIKNKKLARIFIALAGPFSNLILGIIFSLSYSLILKNTEFALKAQSVSLEHFILNFVFFSALINFGLFIFNLIPIPPLDGHHVLSEILNLNYEQEMKYRQFGMPILLILIFSDRITGIDLLPIHKAVFWLFENFVSIL